MRTIAGTTWPVEDAQSYIRARVNVDANGCWIWQLNTVYDPSGFGGYGRHRVPLKHGGHKALAHRTSFDAFIGTPYDMVLHKCDVPACCNPDHLYCGDICQNAQDRCVRNRAAKKLTAQRVMFIRAMIAAGESQADIARLENVNASVISRIANGRSWAWLP